MLERERQEYYSKNKDNNHNSQNFEVSIASSGLGVCGADGETKNLSMTSLI